MTTTLTRRADLRKAVPHERIAQVSAIETSTVNLLENDLTLGLTTPTKFAKAMASLRTKSANKMFKEIYKNDRETFLVIFKAMSNDEIVKIRMTLSGSARRKFDAMTSTILLRRKMQTHYEDFDS